MIFKFLNGLFGNSRCFQLILREFIKRKRDNELCRNMQGICTELPFKRGNMSIKEDLKKYPCYLYRNCKLIKLRKPPDNWYGFQIHHFVRQSIRKNSLNFYKRVEHLQKLILVPSQMNYDLETMGEVRFFQKYGIDKNLLVFSRLKWREGFYD